eukprot:CAMPEP_0196753374 /NCGR_PEP_ID=MMETSP1091-20130531/90524_1 /TAXON_ID=302021 /ORGANISM="Rhodomonas sp., Strain CCMP768" /LENGTH=70 /DNA_ID=CAMNT_0042101475 /DNA_START=42 /DNA_END=250 /DNA_ORIENTATION=-
MAAFSVPDTLSSTPRYRFSRSSSGMMYRTLPCPTPSGNAGGDALEKVTAEKSEDTSSFISSLLRRSRSTL